MPFRTGGGGGFTGDTNMATFIDEVVETFLTDAKVSGGLAWISQIPSRGKGTTPDFEFLFSRGGIGTEAPPFWFMQTAAKSLYIYSGDDVDTTQESFDQPGNPMNYPPADPPGDIATNGIYGNVIAQMVNTAVGSYDDYWLFGGPTGEYCHVVLKVGAREYRHFHCGLLTPLQSDFPADAHYISGHRWGNLAPDRLGYNNNIARTNGTTEHQPYSQTHLPPFRNNQLTNVSAGFAGFFGDVRTVGMWVYVPGGHGTDNYDWWMMTAEPLTSNGGTYGRATNASGNAGNFTNMTKNIGDVNNAINAVLMGAGWISGYDDFLGAIPFAADQTFTTDGRMLVPIYFGAHSDFESALRWSPLAQVPDIFRVNMDGRDAESEIVVGSETYVLFPLINKDSNNTVDGEGYSANEGLAYRKITANAT